MVADSDHPPASLPRGPHGLGRELVSASQRARLLDAITDEVNAKGYAATTVDDVIKRAGVSRKTFYELFANKEDCFLAAFDKGQVELIDEIVAASGAAGDDPEARLRAGYQALCSGLARRPAFARVFLLAAPAAGDAVQARRAAWREASVERLSQFSATASNANSARSTAPTNTIARAVVGANEAIIADHVERFGPESLPELVPTVLAVARSLLLGANDLKDLESA